MSTTDKRINYLFVRVVTCYTSKQFVFSLLSLKDDRHLDIPPNQTNIDPYLLKRRSYLITIVTSEVSLGCFECKPLSYNCITQTGFRIYIPSSFSHIDIGTRTHTYVQIFLNPSFRKKSNFI